jgi:Protein of unknown function (DUF3562)
VSEPTYSLVKASSDESAVTALAQRTHIPIEIVRHLYDQELAELRSKSTVKNFLGVIASRRVKERLRKPPVRLAKAADPSTLLQ